MRQSLKKRYYMMTNILFLIILLQFIVVLYTISQATDIYSLASDIQSIMIIFMFGLFIYLVIIYNYLPYRLRRSVGRVRELVDEISNGNYQLDIESSLLDQDRDFQELILAIQKMLEIIMRFDAVKSDKIFEHNQRIVQLIDLLPVTVIIANVNGDLVYLNDKFRERFPNIDEQNNLNEVMFKDDFYHGIFDVLRTSLRMGNNVYDEKLRDENSSLKVLIKGSIIRNRKGNASGAVFALDFSGDEKQD
jgi:signal transduction histidine kinase